MECEEREKLKTELKGIGIKEIPRYAFYKEAYINITMPLPYRVHDVITCFSQFLTVILFSITTAIATYYFLATLEIEEISLMLAYVSFVISCISIYFYLHHLFLEKVRKESIIFKKARKPEGISIWKEGKEKI
jgi:hypothetical protein